MTALSHMSGWLASKEGQACLQALQTLATWLALAVGAVWTWLLFVRRRQRYPRADLDQSVAHWLLPDGRILLHVSLVVANRGEILLRVVNGFVMIQEMVPWSEEAVAAFESLNQGKREVAWPLLEKRELRFERHELEIEPGEEEQLDVDFVVGAEVERVVVYSYLKNETKRRREIGWSETSIYDIGHSGKAGSVPDSREKKEAR